MKFILKTSCSDEFYDGHEYAMVEITHDKAAELMRNKQMFDEAHAQDSGLMGMLFYSADTEYFSQVPDEWSGLFEVFDDAGFFQVPHSFTLNDEQRERSDGDRLLVEEEDVYWLCRSGEVQIETARLPYSEITRAALEIPEVQKA